VTEPSRIEPMARKPHAPTKHWATYTASIADHVKRTAAQRAARDRERTDSTDYHHAAEAAPTGE
jgi:hypothetical protein